MNKKFSTLLVSMLLAGGLFSVNAQTAFRLDDAAGTDYYYVLKVDGRDANKYLIPYNDSYSVSVNGNSLVQEQGRTAVTKANVWKASKVVVNGETIGYKFVNANGVALRFDKNGNFTTKNADVVYDTFSHGIKNGNVWDYILFAVDKEGKALTDKKLKESGSGYVLGTDGTPTQIYSLPVDELTADELNAQLENGFSMTIGKTKGDKDNAPKKLVWDGAYNLEGNVFTGKLTAEAVSGGVKLKNEAGKYIVLTSDKWGNLSNNLQDGDHFGYKFTTMTQAQIDKAENIKSTTFVFTQPSALAAEPLEVKAIVGNEGYELNVTGVNGTYYLTTGNADDNVNVEPLKAWDITKEEFVYDNTTSQLVGKASFTNNWNGSTTTENTYVKFGDDNNVDYAIFKDAIWNITRTELDAKGKVVETLVAGPSCDPKFAWVPAAQVALAYPEGQWLWNGETFVNRESGRDQSIVGLRKIDGKDLVFSNGNYTYTFTKVGAPSTNYTEGYLSAYTNDDLKQKAFRIATPIKSTGDTVYLAKDDDGALTLTKDKVEAIAFRLEREVINGSSAVRHYTTYASAKTNSGVADDVLNLSKYTVTDATSGESLAFDSKTQKFILSDNSTYQKLVFKNKAENLYNIVQDLSAENDYNNDNKYIGKRFDEFCTARKLYSAFNTSELKRAEAAYKYIANDLFVLDEVGAEQHVSNIEGDTVKIFREADHNYFLFEKGQFLGLENFLDSAYKNAALYVDSAAGKGTWRQEYLLAVGVENVTDGYTCPLNPEHNTQAWRDEHNGGKPCADAVKDRPYKTGRYLVNLVDSAKAQTEAGVKDAKNIYIYQNYTSSEPYYKLGFVPAIHIGDSLIILSSNDTINLSSNAFDQAKVCDFAFHYVDADRTSFIIETAYDYKFIPNELTEKEEYSATKGYIKYHNGVPVVTRQISEAEVFTLEQTSEAPTANDDVTVATVKVIAGEGQVTIAGAAGKKVVVSNILGQVVANTVLSSDNATIAAPAGVVVVAVEGEAAVKAVVK